MTRTSATGLLPESTTLPSRETGVVTADDQRDVCGHADGDRLRRRGPGLAGLGLEHQVGAGVDSPEHELAAFVGSGRCMVVGTGAMPGWSGEFAGETRSHCRGPSHRPRACRLRRPRYPGATSPSRARWRQVLAVAGDLGHLDTPDQLDKSWWYFGVAKGLLAARRDRLESARGIAPTDKRYGPAVLPLLNRTPTPSTGLPLSFSRTIPRTRAQRRGVR